MNINWFNKERAKRPVNEADITIKKTRSGMALYVRNNNSELMTETGYIRIGVPEEDRNMLVFMAADKKDGWKLAKFTTHDDVKIAQFTRGKVIDLLARFEGDYMLDITDDNLFCINRKEIL